MVGLGAPFVLYAGWRITSNLKMRSRAIGTIVAITYGDEGGDLYPVVEFRTQDPYSRPRFTSDAMMLRKPPIGSLVRVRYDRRDPGRARIATFFGSWSEALFVLLLGGFPFVVGLLGMAGA